MQSLTQTSTFASTSVFTAARPSAARAGPVARRASLSVSALASPPRGVTQPPRLPAVPPAMFGFVEGAEKLNSRACMLGFFALLLLEAVTGKPIFEVFGIAVGNGLDLGL